MASSDSDKSDTGETAKPFKGITFYIHGQWAGWTRNKVTRALESGGGQVSDKLENVKISHMILSEHLWSRRSTANADPTIKRTMKANEENRTEEDEDCNRVWLLPIEWLEQSLQEGTCLPEVEHDLERVEDEKRAERNCELAKERRKNGGVSRYGRGQRRRIEMKRAMEAELKRQAEIDKQGLAPDPDAFAGVAALPGAWNSTPLGTASSGTANLASEPLGPSSVGAQTQEENGASATPAHAAPTSSAASQSSQQIDLSSPDPLSRQRSVDFTLKGYKPLQLESGRLMPSAGSSTGNPQVAKGQKKPALTLDDMTSSSDEEPPSAKAGRKRSEKKAPQQGKAEAASGSTDKAKATAQTGKAPKSAREQALEAIAKSPSKPKTDVSPAAASQQKKPRFDDFRKKPLTLFSGGSRHLPPKPNKPAARSGEASRAKQTDKNQPTVKVDAGGDDGSSSDDIPLSQKTAPRRTRSGEAKRPALSEKSRNAKTDEKAKPSFKVDANGKKRARFVGDTSDEDTTPRDLKQLKKGAQKAKKASPIVISDSDSD